MIKLKPIVENRTQEEIIFRKIKEYFDDLLFTFLEQVVRQPLENATDINWYLKRGYIVYDNGYFILKRKLPNKISRDFEKLGAKWSKAKKAYYIKPQRVPIDIAQTVAEIKIYNQDKVDRINKYLVDLQENLDTIPLNFDKEVIKIELNLNKQLKDSLGKIDIIPPMITDFQRTEIAKNYTKNLDYYIKKWAKREIVKLREDLEPYVMQGYRAESLEELIQKHKNVSARKAKFLARQETKLLVAEYRKNRYKQAGVSSYIWRTVLDGRERELHKELNGQVFTWDNPPIIDSRTGQKGNPGEAYNCRCIAVPVVDLT